MSEIKKQWYVVRAIGGKENKVKEYIEAEIRHNNLEEYISQVLIPTEKVYTIRNGKKVSKEKVSYPGYVLVEAAFVGQIPIIIRNTPNVLGFLGDTKEDSRKMNATPLRPQEVARILGAFVNSAITGVNGGVVVLAADDPSMHSSQNEQDSRFYGKFALIPILEPSSQQEAYDMMSPRT